MYRDRVGSFVTTLREATVNPLDEKKRRVTERARRRYPAACGRRAKPRSR
jgi:hypothetical protein